MDFLEALDQGLWNGIQAHRQPGLDAVMLAFSFLGSPLVLTMGVVTTLVILCLQRRHHTGAVLAATFVVGIGVLAAVRELVGRERPQIFRDALEAVAATPCFPSERAFLATIVYLSTALALGGSRRWPLVAASGVVLLIGVSRAYLGVCFPSDVVGGWVGGAAWLLACRLADEQCSARKL